MVYNHLKDKVKSFLQPFAESGEPVGAEDIKAYFEKLRGDSEAIRDAGGAALTAGDWPDDSGDSRKEQSGKSREVVFQIAVKSWEHPFTLESFPGWSCFLDSMA